RGYSSSGTTIFEAVQPIPEDVSAAHRQHRYLYPMRYNRSTMVVGAATRGHAARPGTGAIQESQPWALTWRGGRTDSPRPSPSGAASPPDRSPPRMPAHAAPRAARCIARLGLALGLALGQLGAAVGTTALAQSQQASQQGEVVLKSPQAILMDADTGAVLY